METKQDTTDVTNSKSQNVGINPFKSFVPEFALGTFVYYNDESSMMKPEAVIIICALVFITLYYFCNKNSNFILESLVYFDQINFHFKYIFLSNQFQGSRYL